jgi:hypothetical protein
LGVGSFVGLAVGLGVGRGVGAAVGAALGAGVGSRVAAGWLGRGVDVAPGAPVGPPGATGEPTAGVAATADVGLGLRAVPDGLADGDDTGAEPDGEDTGAEPDGVVAGVSPAVGTAVALEVACAPLVGAGVGTIATWLGPPLALARCCSSTPPTLRAIVARTIFRTPRLRTSRAR